MDFWEDWLKLQPNFIVKQLELWACNENKSRWSVPLALFIWLILFIRYRGTKLHGAYAKAMQTAARGIFP